MVTTNIEMPLASDSALCGWISARPSDISALRCDLNAQTQPEARWSVRLPTGLGDVASMYTTWRNDTSL